MSKDINLIELDREVKRIQQLRKPNTSPYNYSGRLSKKAKRVLDDIERNHNNSWAMFMYERNLASNAMDKVAIKYRGNKITYGEMYSKAFEYARSLKAMGIKKGDQVPVCISNIPEYKYILLACSFIGAQIHLFGDWFDKKSIKNILNNTKSKVLIASEDCYEKISDVVEESNIETPVLMSLSDSLMKKDGKPYNPYQEFEGADHDFSYKFNEIKAKSTKKVINQKTFINYGYDYKGQILEDVGLDDISTITYTSGTTEKGTPKGVKHSNRVYITVSRFKLSDVSGIPEMKNLTTQFEVPTYSHTNISNLTDTLFCNCTFVSEPFNETEFFLKSLLINKPNYCQSAVGRWINLGKELSKPENRKIKLPFLMLPDAVGEGCSIGEEKYLNRVSREHKFGIAKLPFPLSPVKFALGGGTCEGGGLFFTLFHALQEKKLAFYGKKYSLGLVPVKMAEYEVINQNGEYCGVNEPGILAVNSPASFSGYTDESLNPTAYITDKYGKKWINMGTLAYKSDPIYNSIKMKSRTDDYVYLSDGSMFPTFRIEEAISMDTKNIMSVAIIKREDGTYVCHLEKQPYSKKNIVTILKSCALRLEKELPREIFEKIFFRVRSYEEGFPVSHSSGKRDFKKLKSENNVDKLIYIEDVFNLSASQEKNKSLELK